MIHSNGSYVALQTLLDISIYRIGAELRILKRYCLKYRGDVYSERRYSKQCGALVDKFAIVKYEGF